jgi:tetratricopeptide (TPR) repeat protein
LSEVLKRVELSRYLTREPVTLALLTLLAAVFFLAVSGLSRIYQMQQETLAERWAAQGNVDLATQQFKAAVTDFRTALLYARDNNAYQLNLAQGLMGLNRAPEARAYLINLWEREPDNGLVSLDLARIAVGEGDTEEALRFYHNAIYATWTGGNQEQERRSARLELISYLLQIGAKTQAEAELIDLGATLGEDAGQQALLGGLFLRVGNAQRALAAFRESLKLDPKDEAAMAGAGAAAFKLGLYLQAARYLREAVAAYSEDEKSSDLLNATESVLRWDPYREQISDAQRNQIVVDAFAAAGQRINSCVTPSVAEKNLAQAWATLKPKITIRGLRQDPDQADTAMNLVFGIERQAGSGCNAASDTDKALLLVANLQEDH